MNVTQMRLMLQHACKLDAELLPTLGDFVNAALRQVQKDRSWPCMKTEEVFTIPAGASRVALPSYFKELQSLDPVHVVLADGTTRPVDVAYVEQEERRRDWTVAGLAQMFRVALERDENGAWLRIADPASEAIRLRVKFYRFLADLPYEIPDEPEEPELGVPTLLDVSADCSQGWLRFGVVWDGHVTGDTLEIQFSLGTNENFVALTQLTTPQATPPDNELVAVDAHISDDMGDDYPVFVRARYVRGETAGEWSAELELRHRVVGLGVPTLLDVSAQCFGGVLRFGAVWTGYLPDAAMEIVYSRPNEETGFLPLTQLAEPQALPPDYELVEADTGVEETGDGYPVYVRARYVLGDVEGEWSEQIYLWMGLVS